MSGRDRVLGSFRVAGAGEGGREALVEALHGDGDDGAELLEEALGLLSLGAALAAKRDGQPDDDALDLFPPHELEEAGQAGLRRGPLDDLERLCHRPGRI